MAKYSIIINEEFEDHDEVAKGLEFIANMIKGGYTCGHNPNWDIEKTFDCEFCEDTGETDVMESVYPGEAHQAATGTQKCICQIHEDDGNDYDQDK